MSQLSLLPALPPKFPYPLLDFELMGAVGSALRSPIVDMSTKQAKFVENTIASNKVVIFSKTYCPYCTMAKEVRKLRDLEKSQTVINIFAFQPFKKLNVDATIIELDGNPDGNEIQAVLGEITGARTVGALNILHYKD